MERHLKKKMAKKERKTTLTHAVGAAYFCLCGNLLVQLKSVVKTATEESMAQ